MAEHLGLVYAGTPWGNEWPFRRAGEARTVRIPARLQTNNNQLLCEAACKGMGIVIQPTFNVWGRIRSGELELLLDDWHVANSRSTSFSRIDSFCLRRFAFSSISWRSGFAPAPIRTSGWIAPTQAVNTRLVASVAARKAAR